MEISSELLFFFSALGGFNGLLLGGYFLMQSRKEETSNFFLGWLLIVMSIRIGKSVFFYFNEQLALIYLQIGLSACLFIGPFLYLYVRSMTRPSTNLQSIWRYHIGAFFMIAVIGGLLYPFEQYPQLWRPYILMGIYYIWLGYIIWAGYYMIDVFRRLFTWSNFTSSGLWLLSIYLGNVLIWIAYYFCGFGSYILGALSFSFMLYVLVLLFVFKNRGLSKTALKTVKYQDKKLTEIKVKALDSQLHQLIENGIYKNPNLRLSDMAKEMNTTTHIVSQFLNDNRGQSFSTFINTHRVEEAKRVIMSREDFSLDGIGYECGFNSSSTFFATFKKITGKTPAQFRSDNQK